MSEKNDIQDIVVIGGGVVGLTTAFALQTAGKNVCVVERGALGMGASYGNAGTIADYAVAPVGTPDVLKNIFSLLLDQESPLTIRPAALLSLMPWLLRFVRQSLPNASANNAVAIAALVASSLQEWKELAARVGATPLLRQNGCLYLYESDASFAKARADIENRRRLGIAVELIGPSELIKLEPAFSLSQGGAAYFPKATSVLDPLALVLEIARAFQEAGGRVLAHDITHLTRKKDHVMLRAGLVTLRAKTVIITAGAHSKDLARQAGDRIPLETERGYHLEWDMHNVPISRPTCPTARGFYFSPMRGRLRVAGTVELGGLTAAASPHRLEALEKAARQFFPDLPKANRSWMGFRPSIPDSRPVIGPSSQGADVLYGFGHGHIGLTLAPITANILRDLCLGRSPSLDIAPYSAQRF